MVRKFFHKPSRSIFELKDNEIFEVLIGSERGITQPVIKSVKHPRIAGALTRLIISSKVLCDESFEVKDEDMDLIDVLYR